MAEVMVSIGGREYRLSCREGEQERLLHLAERVDAKTDMARSAVGDTTEPRLLLFASLFLADEIEDLLSKAKAAEDRAEKGRKPDHAPADAVVASALQPGPALPDPALAKRIDAISARLARMTAALTNDDGAAGHGSSPDVHDPSRPVAKDR